MFDFYPGLPHIFEPGAVWFLLRERLKLKRLGQKLQDKALSWLFLWGTRPSLCPPRWTLTLCYKMDQAFPLNLASDQTEGLGTRLHVGHILSKVGELN